VTSLVALESAPAMPQSSVPSTPPTPDQIRDALNRYQMVDSVPFLARWLSDPIGARMSLLWQRRRWAILIRRATTHTVKRNDGMDMVVTNSLLAALPKDIFRLIAYLL
jgi:hypothetical protein